MQGRAVRRGAIAIACGLWLAGTSTAAAQTASASPPAPAARAASSAGTVRGRDPGTAALPGRPEVRGRGPGRAVRKKVGASPGAAVDFTARVGRTPVSVGAAFDYLLYGTRPAASR